MIVYKIYFSAPREESAPKSLRLVNVHFSEWLTRFSTSYPIPVDNNYMVNRYGVENNAFEIDYFRIHRLIWDHFLSAGEEYCLIMEEGVQLSVPFEELLTCVPPLAEMWDIVFPFDRLEDGNGRQRTEIYSSSLGFFWGGHIYFISQEGAHKLMAIDAIRQPLDEEILQMSSNDKLNSFFANTEAFVYDEAKSPSLMARKQCLRETIRNFSAWKEQDKEKARQLIRLLSIAAGELEIPLVLHGGTLLGHIRHGGIMPWDDDIDFGIPCSEIYRFLEAIEKQGLVRYCRIFHVKKKSASWFYKFWLDDGTAIDGYDYTFPFVDIWLYYQDADHVWYEEGYFFQRMRFLPLQTILFEGSPLQIPAMPLASLDDLYPDWREYIRIYSWSHRKERNVF
ncbi:MAG TPA: LicD family protein, partial [Puia sp.]|nr:LicD family protein [Puia sp.]